MNPRTKINNHLDKLQEDLMKELTWAEKHVTAETRELLVSLNEKQKELTEHQTNVVNIEKNASDLQTLLAVKQIEKEVETQDRCLQSQLNSDRLNQTKLAYKIDTGLKTIVTNIQKFGKVVVESKPCELIFARKKEKQAQMSVADLLPPMSVEKYSWIWNRRWTQRGRGSQDILYFQMVEWYCHVAVLALSALSAQKEWN